MCDIQQYKRAVRELNQTMSTLKIKEGGSASQSILIQPRESIGEINMEVIKEQERLYYEQLEQALLKTQDRSMLNIPIQQKIVENEFQSTSPYERSSLAETPNQRRCRAMTTGPVLVGRESA